MEIAISAKFEKNAGNIQDDPMPLVVFYGWLLTFVAFLFYYIYLRTTSEENQKEAVADTPSSRRRSPRKAAKKNN